MRPLASTKALMPVEVARKGQRRPFVEEGEPVAERNVLAKGEEGDLVEMVADLPFERDDDGAVPALLVGPGALDAGDEPDRNAVRDLAAVLAVADGAHVVADLRPDDDLGAARAQFGGLGGERQDRGVRI